MINIGNTAAKNIYLIIVLILGLINRSMNIIEIKEINIQRNRFFAELP
jgi:hypothetical protein